MPNERSEDTLKEGDLIDFFEREIKTIIHASDNEIIHEKLTEWEERSSEQRDGALAKVLGGSIKRSGKMCSTNPDSPYWLNALKTVSYVAMNVAMSGGRSNADLILRYTARPMLEIVCLKLPTDVMVTVMESLISIARDVPRAVREKLYTNLRSHLRSVATWLALCGDYPTQVLLLRILVHLTPRAGVEHIDAAQYIFDVEIYNEEVISLFKWNLDFTNFAMDSRVFLTLMNAQTEKVIHLVCESVVLDDVPLIGLSGEKGDPLYVELNTGSCSVTLEWSARAVARECVRPLNRHLSRCDSCQLTVPASSLRLVRMHRSGDGKAVIDIQARAISITRSAPDVVSSLRLYPMYNLLGAHGALRTMYADNYVCEIKIDETEDYINMLNPRPFIKGSNISSEDEERTTETSHNSTSKVSSVPKLKRCSVVLSDSIYRGNKAADASSESSASTTSLMMLRETLEKQKSTKNIFNNNTKMKCSFEPAFSDVREIVTKVAVRTSSDTTNEFGTCEVDNGLEQRSDVQLVDDLFKAAMTGLCSAEERSEKDSPVIDKEKLSDNALSSARNTKDKANVSSKSERTEKVGTMNKENTAKITLENQKSTKDFFYNNTKMKYSFEPAFSDVREIVPKMAIRTSSDTTNEFGTCEVGNGLEQGSDHQLVDDLLQAAFTELLSSAVEQEKDAPVIDKEKLSDNARPSPMNTKDRADVLSKSERTEKVRTMNKENTANKTVSNSPKHCTDARQNLKTNKKQKCSESDIKAVVLSENRKSPKLDKRQDAIIPESTIGDSTSDAIPDTPNVDMTKLFKSISVRKKSAQCSKSSSTKGTDVKSISPKREYCRVEGRTLEKSKPSIKPKMDSLPTNGKLATTTVTSESEEVNVSSMKPRKRKLYSPKSGYIIQDIDSENDEIRHYPEDEEKNAKEIHITKKKQKSVSSPYVLIVPLQVKPKSTMDKMFDKLKASNGEDQTVTLVNVTKDIAVYNFESSEDEFQTEKKWKRTSGDTSKVAKTTNVTNRKRKAPKISKVQKGIATTIKISSKPEHVLADEKIRRRAPSEDLLDISLQGESLQQKKPDREDVIPKGLDSIEIEEIPQNDDQKSTDAGDFSLIKPAVSMPKEQDTTDIKQTAQKQGKKPTNVDSQSLAKPKKKPTAMQKKHKPTENKKTKAKEKSVKEQLDEVEGSSSPPSLIIEVEKKHNESFSFCELVKAVLSSKETNTHTNESQTIIDDVLHPRRQLSTSVCEIDLDACQSSEKSNVTRRSHIVIDSSPETAREKSIATVTGTPINAHGDGEEEPPNLRLLEDTVQGRDLQTERLNAEDREFIGRLKENSESLQCESSFIDLDRIMSQKSDSDKENSALHFIRTSHSTPNKSDSTSCNPKTFAHSNIQWSNISPIGRPEQNMTNVSQLTTSSSPTVQRENSRDRIQSQHSTGCTEGFFELKQPAQSNLYSTLQPKSVKKIICQDSRKTEDRADNLRQSFISQVSEAESTVKDICEVLLQTIQTGIRESSCNLKSGIVSALAEMLASFEENKKLAQKQHEECTAKRRRLDEEIEMKYQEQQERHHLTMENLKNAVLKVMETHTRQCSLRVDLLREDVQLMLRRYRRTMGRSLRLRSPSDD